MASNPWENPNTAGGVDPVQPDQTTVTSKVELATSLGSLIQRLENAHGATIRIVGGKPSAGELANAELHLFDPQGTPETMSQRSRS